VRTSAAVLIERAGALVLLVAAGFGWLWLDGKVAAVDAGAAARIAQLEQLRVLSASRGGEAGSIDAVAGLVDGRALRWRTRHGLCYLVPEVRQ
jgi:hypothetical protein